MNRKAGSVLGKKEKTLESSFEELNSIIDSLEKEDISLEDSFGLYHKGMQLLKYCNDSIDKVEKELMILEENGMDE
nr:exodeoxyribonuclease VII small subunit [Clostridium sp. Marseille-P299]